MSKGIFFYLFTLLATANLSIAQQPIISSVQPQSGPAGTTVNIVGSNFDTNPVNSIVSFGVHADILSASTTLLTVKVPYGTKRGPISVTSLSNGRIGSWKIPFHTTFPEDAGIASINFDPMQQFSLGGVSSNAPLALQTADIDGDGKMDIIATNNDNGRIVNGIYLLKNNAVIGNISFSTSLIRSFTGNDGCHALDLKDLDGDGKPDLAILLQGGTGRVQIQHNTSTPGNASFSPTILTLHQGVTMLGLEDLDKDGRIDIIADSASFISAYRNISTPGNIAFAPRQFLCQLQSGAERDVSFL